MRTLSDEREQVLARRRAHRLAQNGRLTELREASGLSQSDVARFLGVSQPTVSLWEAGKLTPRAGHAAALLDLLEGGDAA